MVLGRSLLVINTGSYFVFQMLFLSVLPLFWGKKKELEAERFGGLTVIYYYLLTECPKYAGQDS